jgi:hypothetical protein
MEVLVVYYSMYGHIHRLAEAIAEGVKMADGAKVQVRRVPETLSVPLRSWLRPTPSFLAHRPALGTCAARCASF